MIRYRRYAEYEDLQYYNELYEAERKKMREQEKEKTAINKSKINSSVSSEKQTQNNPCFYMSGDKKESAFEMTEQIDLRCFENMDLIIKNIIFIALRNKTDFTSILENAEDLIKKDKRTKPRSKSKDKNHWLWLPVLNKAMVFLSIVADMLNCNIQEFFIDNEKVCKEYIYSLLKTFEDSEWCGNVEKGTGVADISYSCQNIDNLIYEKMSLTISRDYVDNIPYYLLSCGDLTINASSGNDYLTKGAYLIEESDGELKALVEKLIATHPEWEN